MSTNGFAQGEAPGCRTVFKFANWGLSRMPKHDSPPHLQGKALDGASAISKIVAHRNRAPAGKVHTRADSIDCRSVPREVQFRRTLRFFRPANATNAAAQSRRYISPRAAPPRRKSLRNQLLVSKQHHSPRNSQLVRQLARRRQLLTSPKSSRKNCLPQSAVHLPVQRLAPFGKWYHQLHKKWLCQNTTSRVNLISAQRAVRSSSRRRLDASTQAAARR